MDFVPKNSRRVNVYTVDVIMKKIILVGATSGVGLGFIESQIEKDVFITCLYRDETKLDKLKQKFAKYLEKLSFVKIDISDVPNIENSVSIYDLTEDDSNTITNNILNDTTLVNFIERISEIVNKDIDYMDDTDYNYDYDYDYDMEEEVYNY